MAIHALLLVATLGLAPVPDTSDDELKAVQGEWNVVKVAWHGKPEAVADWTATFDKDSFTMRDKSGVGRYQIKRLKAGQLDLLKHSPNPGAGHVLLGIYAVKDNSLQICISIINPKDDPINRPMKFESPENELVIVYFLERKTDGTKGTLSQR